MSQLLEALRNAMKAFTADAKTAESFSHNLIRGEAREEALRTLLKENLPTFVGVASGQVLEHDGGMSRQLDVILHDALFTPVLFRAKRHSLVPCEGVYGAVEVKTTLDGRELHAAIENSASLKRLKRQPTNGLQILPHFALTLGNGLECTTACMNPFVTWVVGLDGLVAETTVVRLNEAWSNSRTEADRALLPDFVFNLEKGFIAARYVANQDGSPGVQFPAPLGGPFNGYTSLELGEDTLLAFYLSVIASVTQLRLAAPNMNDYFCTVLYAGLKRQ